MHLEGVPFSVKKEELARAYTYLLENPLNHTYISKTESPELLDSWADRIINDRQFPYAWRSQELDMCLNDIAKNKGTTGKTLQKIYDAVKNRTDSYILIALAGNPNCPTDILGLLCVNSCSSVRAAVAGNPSTPPDVLLTMKKDRSPYVKIELASNPHTPQEVLAHLARSEQESVVTAVAKNINTSYEILNKIILKTIFIKPKKAAINNPNYPLDKIVDYATGVRIFLHDVCAPSYSPDVVAAALASPRLPAELANQLLEEMLACQKSVYNLDVFITYSLQHPEIRTELILVTSMSKKEEIRKAAQEVLKNNRRAAFF